MMKKFTDNVILVTGASSGIGMATAVRFAQAGADLVIQYARNEAGIRKTESLIQAAGRKCQVLQVDFDVEAQQLEPTVDAFCRQAWEQHRKFDAVVHLAGGDVLTNDRRDWSYARRMEFLSRVDLQATLLLARNLGLKMKNVAEIKPPAMTPAIALVGWDQAATGQAGENGEIFSAIKGGIMAFTKSLAKSLAPKVRVNCVAPGWIQTAWGSQTSTYWDERAKRESLMKRWGSVDDVASGIEFLISKDASFLTGQTLDINGGQNFGKD